MSGPLRELSDLQFDTRDLVGRLRTLCGDDEQAFLDTLDGLVDTTDAARAVVRWMVEQDANAVAMKALAATYIARAKVFEGRWEGGRTALFHFLQYLGVKSMPLPEATLSIAAGTPSLTGGADPEKLPDNLVRIKRGPNKIAIKAELDAGRAVDGYALSNASPHLSVRMK